MPKLDLSGYYPGCGNKHTYKDGPHTVTIEFNSNAEEATKALAKLGSLMQNASTSQKPFRKEVISK